MISAMNKSFLFVIMIISTSFTGCIDTGEEPDFTEQIKNLEDKIEALEKEIENLESEKSNETIEDLELEIDNLESEKLKSKKPDLKYALFKLLNLIFNSPFKF